MLKIGIIGSGFGQYGLLPAFRGIKDCEVVALCGSKRPQLVAYCKKIGFTNLYDDWQDMLDNEDLDAVAIAVTPEAQYTIAKAAIAKGLHIFAEKPLAANLRQSKEILTLAKKKKITHGIDFIFPHIGQWQKVQDLLDTQAYGKLQHISVHWDFLSYDLRTKHDSWKTAVAKGGGALSFFFSHSLHYIEQFAGAITKIQSQFSYDKDSVGGAESGVDLQFQCKNKITGDAHIRTNSRGLTRHELTFYCEQGVIVLKNTQSVVDNFTITILQPNNKKVVEVIKDIDKNNEDERVKIVRKLATTFVKACVSKKQMSPSFEDGHRVQELIEKIRLARTTK